MRSQVTCRCSAYPFPHRKTGGKCKGIYKVTPKSNCRWCHGSGTTAEHHPWGSTYATEYLICECVSEQLPESFDDYKDEVEVVDNSWQGADGPEFEYDD